MPYPFFTLAILLCGPIVQAQSTSLLPWWKEELQLQVQGGLVWRQPRLAGPADRIGTGWHTDGFWALGGRITLGNTLLSLEWSRQKQSMYYTISDLGRTTAKVTTPYLSYTSLPLRIGHRLPLWSKRVALIPHLSIVWSFMDEGPHTQGGGARSYGRYIDNNIGDTVDTMTAVSARILQRNTFTIGPGVELTVSFGRISASAGVEYLWSKDDFVAYTVDYARTSTLQGAHSEQATIQNTPSVLAMRWGLLVRLWQLKEPDTATW